MQAYAAETLTQALPAEADRLPHVQLFADVLAADADTWDSVLQQALSTTAPVSTQTIILYQRSALKYIAVFISLCAIHLFNVVCLAITVCQSSTSQQHICTLRALLPLHSMRIR
jgi:hypothetical protein